jgi:hypothetical protein
MVHRIDDVAVAIVAEAPCARCEALPTMVTVVSMSRFSQ